MGRWIIGWWANHQLLFQILCHFMYYCIHLHTRVYLNYLSTWHVWIQQSICRCFVFCSCVSHNTTYSFLLEQLVVDSYCVSQTHSLMLNSCPVEQCWKWLTQHVQISQPPISVHATQRNTCLPCFFPMGGFNPAHTYPKPMRVVGECYPWKINQQFHWSDMFPNSWC